MTDRSERRYFYTDGPSPLHEARDEVQAAFKVAGEAAEALAKEVGAKSAAGRSNIEGFVFDQAPDESRWKRLRYTSKDGDRLYAPKRNTKWGRELRKRMDAIRVPSAQNILRGTGLEIMRFHEHYMLRSSAGWIGDRIFVTIPSKGEGDDFPDIPPYLTECKRWEMEKYQDEHKQAQENTNEQ